MKDIIELIGSCIIIILVVLIIFNFISSLVCLSIDGNLKFNKIVFTCNFDDKINHHITRTITTETIIGNRQCYLNGVPINCSEMGGIM